MRTIPLESLQPGMIALFGVPWDAHSSYLRGAAAGPSHIRTALANPSANWSLECGPDLDTVDRFVDCGNASVPHHAGARDQIERQAREAVARGARLVALGGDHAVTYPLVRAHREAYPSLTILHIDAHSDLYDEFEGDRYSHACPFARVMEEGLAQRLVQIGIRTMTAHLRAQTARFGVEVVEMKDWQLSALPPLTGDVYLSLDLDGLDPACAPGVSHHEPGGLTTRDVVAIVQQCGGRIVGADVVELNPSRDINEMTAMVAAKLVKEIVGRIIDNF